jgi:hypothetical protein
MKKARQDCLARGNGLPDYWLLPVGAPPSPDEPYRAAVGRLMQKQQSGEREARQEKHRVHYREFLSSRYVSSAASSSSVRSRALLIGATSGGTIRECCFNAVSTLDKLVPYVLRSPASMERNVFTSTPAICASFRWLNPCSSRVPLMKLAMCSGLCEPSELVCIPT